MKLSLNWLNEYVDLKGLSAEELSALLTMKTCEVEKIHPFMDHLSGIPVVRVAKMEKHPDADKLNVCQVETGKGTIQIVTGAPNVKQGGIYPLAPEGVTLPNGMTMKKAKLRGLDSFGMMCSGVELELQHFDMPDGIDSHVDGLLTLPESFQIGKPLSDYFSLADTILEIDNKSITHRPDLWSHFGFAREIAALTGRRLKWQPEKEVLKADPAVDKSLKMPSIRIEDKAALNYSGVLFSGVKVGPSDLKKQARLLSVGMRPINNVVDASNLVMLALGQPNHAFDRGTLGESIVINRSRKNEKIITLDAKEHLLPEGLVVVRDGDKPVALGGVMGGQNTEISAATTSLFFESATFHRADIRKAVARLGIRTESSQRFEKGQNPENSLSAISLFSAILAESCPGLKSGTVHSEFAEEIRRNKITTTFSYLRSRLGRLEISEEKITGFLSALGMKCEASGDRLQVEVPPHRSYFDLTIADDLVEELGRVIGYGEIAVEPVLAPCEVPAFQNHERKLEHTLRDLMAQRYQFTEVFNYAFHTEEEISLDRRHAASAVKLANPIQADLPALRISPLPGLLRNLHDFHKEYSDLRIFEIERIFPPGTTESELPREKVFLAGAVHAGHDSEKSLTTVAALLSDLCVHLGVSRDNQDWISGDGGGIFHPGRNGAVSTEGKPLFRWGQLHPRISGSRGLNAVIYFEAFLEDLLSLEEKAEYNPPARFPASDFEVTVIAEGNRPFAEIAAATGKIRRSDRDTYLESLDHVATYRGPQIGEGKKAVSLRVQWRNPLRTLEAEEVKQLQAGLIKRLEKAGLPLRA